MFSQRKSFFKGKLFYIVLLGLFAFGIWLNQAPIDQNSPEDVNTDSNYPASTGDAVNSGSNANANANANDDYDYDILDNIIGKTHGISQGGLENSIGSENPADEKDQGYYLIKEVDGIIKIFYYDDQGKETLIRETDIAFSLLSVADQDFFQQGVIKHTLEELDELLQDFES